jgi:hypothetical protein
MPKLIANNCSTPERPRTKRPCTYCACPQNSAIRSGASATATSQSTSTTHCDTTKPHWEITTKSCTSPIHYLTKCAGQTPAPYVATSTLAGTIVTIGGWASGFAALVHGNSHIPSSANNSGLRQRKCFTNPALGYSTRDMTSGAFSRRRKPSFRICEGL